jgi:glycosyltransferase involved in cell wall biosynthesis
MQSHNCKIIKKSKLELEENHKTQDTKIKQEIKILVIMPTFNRPEKCNNTIKKILDQTYDNFDLLVIDDGSEKKNCDILENFIYSLKNKKIIFKKNINNLKISGTLNIGLKYFLDNNYDYVTWISDDNLYYDNYLYEMITEEKDFVYTSFLCNNLNDNSKNIQKYEYKDINDVINKFKGIAPFMWSKNAIKKIGFYDETLYGSEDFDYIIRTFLNLKKENIYFKNVLTMEYIRDKESLYYKEKKRIDVEFENVKKKYREYNLENKKDILIVLDNYMKGGLEKHTDILLNKFDFSCDIMVFSRSIKNHTLINQENYKKYDIIIWQNVFNKIPIKNKNQKYIYIVHSQCNWWNKNYIDNIKENNKYIDIYIFVSDSTKENFENNILIPTNKYIIENKIDPIINDKKEIAGLHVSSGSYYEMKGHFELIQKFSKLDKKNNILEIYGEIYDNIYYKKLKNYIKKYNLHNIKLYKYSEIYIERLKEAEYFCLFSKSEGCSYSILEAMALNKKIICSKECISFSQIKHYNLKKNNFD